MNTAGSLGPVETAAQPVPDSLSITRGSALDQTPIPFPSGHAACRKQQGRSAARACLLAPRPLRRKTRAGFTAIRQEETCDVNYECNDGNHGGRQRGADERRGAKIDTHLQDIPRGAGDPK
ncbi:hypothetical protein AAFF_G00008440 [Aldrovandia affinis]|uniref:Uncharacterized protein n=1 Tax=Aldrovandia affinis TaxID=143900 RepID=A0AAD7T7S7_9TELE|nr:hypothetical protein AAFF_G00008440 [Aldrovandia affinis]